MRALVVLLVVSVGLIVTVGGPAGWFLFVWGLYVLTADRTSRLPLTSRPEPQRWRVRSRFGDTALGPSEEVQDEAWRRERARRG